MRNPLVALVGVAVVGLGLMGLLFLNTATSLGVTEAIQTNGLIAGVTCLSLSTVLLMFAVWAFWKRGDPP